MVRSYRKYEAGQTFGTVTTASCNAIWSRSPGSTSSTGAGRAFVGANEDILCWDVKTSDLAFRLHDSDNSRPVTALSQCAAQPDLIAAGYEDGSVRVWDLLSGQVIVRFDGHRSAVTLVKFDREGARLVSGSRDTDIIVWNLLSEQAEFRLRGHKDQITGFALLTTPVRRHTSPHTDEAVDVSGEDEVEERFLLSTSKDALIKLWDLQSPHCIETHVAQTAGECWALGLSSDGDGCITAGNDGELKVWSIDLATLAVQSDSVESKRQDVLKSQGILHRQGKDRTIGVTFHPKQDYVAVHGSEKAVEIWRIRSASEVKRHLQRKKRRRREKAAASGEALPDEAEDDLGAADVGDVFTQYAIIRTGGKVRSADWSLPPKTGNKNLQLLVASTNNQLELYNVTSHRTIAQADSKEAPDYSRALAVELPGHRTDVRALALSSDDRMLASASAGHLKIWNMKTMSCLRTLECGQALCCSFLPGDRMILLGTKTGELELWDIGTSTLIESLRAHDGAIWTLAVSPDGKSVVTGSADKHAKFWRFDVVNEEIPGTRRSIQRLKLTQTRQLKVNDDILSVCFSPDDRLFALSTLDNTVKVFFTDSLKLFLTLYGHKLPVLNISISSDSKLIATCSADKNVRIWGLDFGDCHKAFFAHNDSVMSVAFIPHPVETDEKHILFSTSKDGAVKSWDGDKFEQIQRLDGHKGEVWAMVVSRTGETVVTASHDKSIRVWEVGDDLVFLEEEREKELEEMYESTLARNLDRDHIEEEEHDGSSEEVGKAGKQTITTLTHGEKIIEALELGFTDLQTMRDYELEKLRNPKLALPQRNPLFLALGNITAEEHVLRVLSRVPTPALNDALLVIPFSMLPTFFTFLALFMDRRTMPELAWKVTYFLLQAHMDQVVASRQLREVLGQVLQSYEKWQAGEKKLLGFNLAGLDMMSRDVREREQGVYLDELPDETIEDAAKGRKKRAFASVA
ncbi:WD40 repeat-like protein [Polychaeton citri CBS 116435]|uniref:WD40 repeat-like protein n=1 Tax=Polychaeton citri CBS 116435 TaxID=1314669 RepID=A0A9P4Q9Q3_9PEZI|nr:WD40 repeat-like protein [Polychaeton citri CBS 116435]